VLQTDVKQTNKQKSKAKQKQTNKQPPQKNNYPKESKRRGGKKQPNE